MIEFALGFAVGFGCCVGIIITELRRTFETWPF